MSTSTSSNVFYVAMSDTDSNDKGIYIIYSKDEHFYRAFDIITDSILPIWFSGIHGRGDKLGRHYTILFAIREDGKLIATPKQHGSERLVNLSSDSKAALEQWSKTDNPESKYIIIHRCRDELRERLHVK